MKKTIIILLSIIILIPGCIYYKQVNVKTINQESLQAINKYKPTILISKGLEDSPLQLTEYLISKDTLYGKLVTPSTDYSYIQPTFLRKKMPGAKKLIHLKTGTEVKPGFVAIPFTGLKSGLVYEDAIGLSVLSTTALVGGTTFVGGFIFLLIACNCPYVAVLNPDGTSTFQGSLFPGAMFKMLERTDNLVLSNVQQPQNNTLQIKVYNDQEEVQHIDHIELLGLNHNYDVTGLDNEHNLIAYNRGIRPTKAITSAKEKVLSEIVKEDEIEYNFEGSTSQEALSSLYLTFKTNDLKDNSQLVIRAQQSDWLETTAETFFQQFGEKFPNWVDKMNDADREKYDNNAIEQGISLNAYVKNQGKWEYLGSYENVGTVAKRDMALPIDLSKYNDEVEIKLECAYGFWNLDAISLTDEWSSDITTQSFKLDQASNQDGVDVLQELGKVDEEYVTQPQKGTFTSLSFNVPNDFKGTYVLNATGYYNHERNYAQNMNKKYLRQMKKSELSTHQLSMLLKQYQVLAKANE
jgi:hypothetical protein